MAEPDQAPPGARRAPKLAPAELATRLDRLLATAGGLVTRATEADLERRSPGGDWTMRDLAYQAFRAALAFADGMDIGRLPEAWLSEPAPADLRDGAAIARYGALVRGRLDGWFEGAGPSEYARAIDTDDGPRSGHELLERMTGRAGQRVRQLHALAVESGVAHSDALLSADLEGLPIPRSVW